jgi:transposase
LGTTDTFTGTVDGLRNDEIGAKLDMPRQIVSKWRKRFIEKGLAGLRELPRRNTKRSSAKRRAAKSHKI